MYLTVIDPKTGLVDISDDKDGVLAIKEFREILNDPKLGIYCFTAIALTVDYQSPKRYYGDVDRPLASMEEVTGNRNAFDWNTEVIQQALKKYDKLQYDPTLEEMRIYQDQKIHKLQEIKEYDKLPETSERKKRTTMPQLKKELRLINEDIKIFENRNEGRDVFENSPVRNGYHLSRLEQKLEKRNSFYHV